MITNHFTLENMWGHLWNSAIFEVPRCDGAEQWWMGCGTTDADFPLDFREKTVQRRDIF